MDPIPFVHWRHWVFETIYWVAFFALAVALAVPELRAAGERDVFTEHSLKEALQPLLLLASACLLWVGSRRDCLWVNAMVALCCAMALRESDHWLDRLLFDGAWQLGVGTLALMLVAWVGLQRPRFRTPLPQIAATSGYVVGACVVLATSQALGYKGVWIDLLGPDFERNAKNFVEETTEFLGFGLLLAGALRFRLLRDVTMSNDQARPDGSP